HGEPPFHRPTITRAAAKSHSACPTLLNTTGPLLGLGSSTARSSGVTFDQSTPAWIKSPASASAPSKVSTNTRARLTNSGGTPAISGVYAPTAATNASSRTWSGNTGSVLVVAVTISVDLLMASSAEPTARASAPNPT